MDLEKHIRCKCGKFWGMRNHKRTCKRCKTEVIARGGKLIKENKMAKKPTLKEIVAKVEALTRINNILCEMIDKVGFSLKQYIEFKNDAEDFCKHQKEILEIQEKLKGEK